MGNLVYAPLIRDMRWSYSRLTSFESCPFGWFLRYIKIRRENDTFYASYGSLVHRILAGFYSGRLEKSALPTEFLMRFREEVKGFRPAASTVEKYVKEGAEYLRHPFVPDGEIIGVEEEIEFTVCGIPFVCFIDLLTKEDGKLVITDHKSRVFKSQKEADGMMRQLYLYAAAVQERYGEFPAVLRFNCFRDGRIVERDFDDGVFVDTAAWACTTVKAIEGAEDFFKNPEWFKCRNLCGYSEICEEFEG